MNPYISVLIVDDDQDDAAFLNEGLSQIISAYKVFNVTDGAKCLQFLKLNEAPEIIFLDQNMPKNNGIECLKAIKENPALQDTHVIMFSTSQDLTDIDGAYKLGALFYIVKPVMLSSMVKMLRKVFVRMGKPKNQGRDKQSFLLVEKKLAEIADFF